MRGCDDSWPKFNIATFYKHYEISERGSCKSLQVIVERENEEKEEKTKTETKEQSHQNTEEVEDTVL